MNSTSKYLVLYLHKTIEYALSTSPCLDCAQVSTHPILQAKHAREIHEHCWMIPPALLAPTSDFPLPRPPVLMPLDCRDCPCGPSTSASTSGWTARKSLAARCARPTSSSAALKTPPAPLQLAVVVARPYEGWSTRRAKTRCKMTPVFPSQASSLRLVQISRLHVAKVKSWQTFQQGCQARPQFVCC